MSDAGDAALTAPSRPGAASEELPPHAIDLTEPLRTGGIDVAGPVVDLGEAQSLAYLSGAPPVASETLNGDSWASVAGRLRLRVPLASTGLTDLTSEPVQPPDTVRVRLRHATARSVAVVVDGLLVRVAPLMGFAQTTLVTATVPPDRFNRAMADVELRFPRAPKQAPGVSVSAEVDWVHVTRGNTPVTRVVDLLNDVPVERTPRRALTFYPPTTLSTFEVIPQGAVLRGALAAEAPRGSSRPPRPMAARVRVEADDVAPVETRVEITPNRPWAPLQLDLRPLAGRPARISFSAVAPPPDPNAPPPELPDGGVPVEAPRSEVRMALSSPRIELPGSERSREGPPPGIEHVVLVVVRGARYDRFLPTLSPRLNAGGFAALQQGGVTLEAAAPASREWSALTSVTTGVAADVHRVTEPSEQLAADVPRLFSLLAELGVAVSVHSDDPEWTVGGASRGVSVQGCPNPEEVCHPDVLLAAATENILARRGGRSVTAVIVRSGILPLDPSADDIRSLDPTPYEGTMIPAQTGVLLTRVRRGEIRIDPRDLDRLNFLYDASLRGVDRGLATMLDRLREARQIEKTLFIVVGDRGTALADARILMDGPLTLRASGSVPLLVRGPGIDARMFNGALVTALDPSATVLDVFGIERPAEMDGRSLYRPLALNDRAVPVTINARGDLGLRFGELLAAPRPAVVGGGVALLVPREDGLGVSDVSDARPIARLFAELALARVRSAEARRTFAPVRR